MNCWQGGPYADGSGGWFDITVRSGNGYGFTGDVPGELGHEPVDVVPTLMTRTLGCNRIMHA